MTDIPDARITRHDVYIGGEKLPGLIRKGGFTVKRSEFAQINILTVDFIVGEVVCENPDAQPSALEEAATPEADRP